MTTLDDLKHTRLKTRAAEAAAAQAVTRAQKEVADKLFDVRECERPVEAARDRKALDAATLVIPEATLQVLNRLEANVCR
jgi:hypothetical protein